MGNGSAVVGKWWVVMGWLLAALFLAAGFWTDFSSDAFPLPTMRVLVAANGYDQAMQILPVVICASWLSFRPFHTRDGMLMFRGATLALFVQGMFLFGFYYSSTLLLFTLAAQDALRKQA